MDATLDRPTSSSTASPVATHGPSADAPARTAWERTCEQACDQACRAIAPAWPLDRAIAVNPHWARIGRPVREVAARLGVLADLHVWPPRPGLKQAWEAGRITPADLADAIRLQAAADPEAAAARLTPQACIDALGEPLVLPRLPLLMDVLDDDPARHTRLSWRQAITHQVSQTCAAYFDAQQADWQPERREGLYAFWRDTLTHDHGIGVLMGLPDLARQLDALPATRQAAEHWVLQRLGLPEAVWADYLEAVLLTVHGWASWCAYLGWQAGLEGRSDPHLRDLLAIRLAWGAILLESKDDAASKRAFAALRTAWQHAPTALERAQEKLQTDEVWQLALELGYQRDLAARLRMGPGPAAVAATPDGIEVQAAFCIDVRSEPLRRALEAVWPGVQTIGFAGFFGLPAAYTPLGTGARRPQLPGLLPPTVEVVDRILPAADAAQTVDENTAGDASDRAIDDATDGNTEGATDDPTEAAARARRRRFATAQPVQASSRWPNAAFSYVEAAGVGYLGKLARWLWPGTADRSRDDLAGLPARYRPVCRPALSGLDLEARVGLAARVLRAMGLDRHLAPLVLLVGHGSQSANNAQAAALDCGACCGQTGEVNARVLARLLNEPAVRAGLQGQGLAVPAETVFVAALHNTTTDELEGHDLDLLPPHAHTRWARLQGVLAQAGDQVRRERAPSLGLDPRSPHDALLTQLRRRANDGAETRPEWGLARNACFLIAPRQRSLARVLSGRAFLHDYNAANDADGSLLELLMTAPMLVTHWINWQYHASTCEPQGLGSGNKLLHNVVGGHIGVFEGNGGDLRIGLSRQSLHDGERWIHEPLRLTVVIDAPAERIATVIARHDVVRQLVDHGWLHLWRYGDAGDACGPDDTDAPGLLRYDRGHWLPLPFDAA